jgi:hypothetical protein
MGGNSSPLALSHNAQGHGRCSDRLVNVAQQGTAVCSELIAERGDDITWAEPCLRGRAAILPSPPQYQLVQA